MKREVTEGSKKYPKLKQLEGQIQNGLIQVIAELSEEEFRVMSLLPHSLSDADKSCLASAHERRSIMASDDRVLENEAAKLNV